MAHIDCTFHLNDFQLEGDRGEDLYFLFLWGDGMSLELGLGADDLDYLIKEIEDMMERTAEERRQHEAEELLYQPPDPAPNNLRFCFDELGGLQALYQAPDHLWQMVFEDSEDNSQCHVMMATRQVESLLKRLREEIVKLQ